ncbi:hypothetical protein B0H16DRAFT_1858843 [Mycena metata]|uniref:Uncharacterized protein n=1 Tax=Mycena metata TaxID=1033252 RepID=A0AAD7K312_9AGAR|nr:hypothetical protein B0H16DRAFT_1858843 [Mycena metata]
MPTTRVAHCVLNFPAFVTKLESNEHTQFLVHAPPHAQISLLYEEIFAHLRSNPAHRASKAFLQLYTQLGAQNPNEKWKSLLANPPQLVIINVGNAHGHHLRAKGLHKFIFLSLSTFSLWEATSTGDAMSTASLMVREMVKATIVHELGHCIVSEVVGAMDRDQYFFKASSSSLASTDTGMVSTERIAEAKRLSTPAKVKVDWRDEPEAGEWIEEHIFGGMFQGDRQGGVLLQTDRQKFHVLTDDMLSKGTTEVFVNYTRTFSNYFSGASVSPSPLGIVPSLSLSKLCLPVGDEANPATYIVPTCDGDMYFNPFISRSAVRDAEPPTQERWADERRWQDDLKFSIEELDVGFRASGPVFDVEKKYSKGAAEEGDERLRRGPPSHTLTRALFDRKRTTASLSSPPTLAILMSSFAVYSTTHSHGDYKDMRGHGAVCEVEGRRCARRRCGRSNVGYAGGAPDEDRKTGISDRGDERESLSHCCPPSRTRTSLGLGFRKNRQRSTAFSSFVPGAPSIPPPPPHHLLRMQVVEQKRRWSYGVRAACGRLLPSPHLLDLCIMLLHVESSRLSGSPVIGSRQSRSRTLRVDASRFRGRRVLFADAGAAAPSESCCGYRLGTRSTAFVRGKWATGKAEEIQLDEARGYDYCGRLQGGYDPIDDAEGMRNAAPGDT